MARCGLQASIEAAIAEKEAAGGAVFHGVENNVNPWTQFLALLHRNTLASFRDIGVFWLRLGMYVGLCLALGTIYFQLDMSWDEAGGRAGLLFFTLSFLTFMAISGFPVFVDDMQIFLHERLNGYYGVGVYTLANALASLPFLALISILCTLVVYYLAGLNDDSDRVIYFMVNLWAALVTVRTSSEHCGQRAWPLVLLQLVDCVFEAADCVCCVKRERGKPCAGGGPHDGHRGDCAALSVGHRRWCSHPWYADADGWLHHPHQQPAAPCLVLPSALPRLSYVLHARPHAQRVPGHRRLGLPMRDTAGRL